MGLRDNVAGHPVNESDGILNQTGGLFQNRADLPSQLAAPLHIFGGALDHLLGLLGGVVRFGGQIAHFVGHDCEALSAGAGPGGLHRGIQSQDIRLKRNVFNCFNDLADLLVPLQNIGHGIRQRRHLFMAHSHLFASQAGLFLDLGGGLGIFPGCAVDLGYGSGELLHRAGLLRGALCERLRAGGYLLGAGGNLVRGQIDLLKRVTEVAVDVAHGGQDIRIVALVEVIIPRTDIKVPVGHLPQQVANITDQLLKPRGDLPGSERKDTDLISALVSGDRGGQVSLLQKLKALGAGPDRIADLARHSNRQEDGNDQDDN